MKYGMPTLVECADVSECVGVAVRTGLDFVEINMSFPQYCRASLDINELREISAHHGVFYTIHADEALNPFDFNKKVSDCYFDVMMDTIDTALEISAPIVNMHLQKGIYVTLPDRVILLSDVYREEYLERVGEFIRTCEKRIGDAELRIAIENVDTTPFTASQQAALELFMKSPVFALTRDTGHELCLGFADSHIFERYPDRVIHTHLHDARGKSCHLPLGEGEVNIRQRLSSPYLKTCLVEVKTVKGLERSLDYLRSNKMI